MVVQANYRRATITEFNRERRSSVDRAFSTYCRATAVHPHTTTARRLVLCRHTKPVPGDSQTICDGTNIVWAPVGQSQTVCDGFRSPIPAGHLPETPRQSSTVPRPSGHLQKTSRQSAMVLEGLNDRRGTCR
ncbi:hypothetical protein DPMN_099526 [Dreissena polymorpha]|uniref:Uncharacterized protein n=1 Tax=Dreissena polymorpha TaxID=45954 RepID=A0A9D4LHF3_DREPO|nr:hypothetical protein DPMN_099526 [Dreissena polymorpha]